MPYSIVYHEDVVKRDIPKLSGGARPIIQRAIEEKLGLDPISFGKPLRYTLRGARRLRVGDYRIIYRIVEDKHQVLIITIGHRRDVYE